MRRTVVLIPGWHEKAHDLRTLTHGRGSLPGLTARGFDALTFELQMESLTERIDRFALFLRGLRKREPERFPVSLIGYSMGGIVARGLLRRHPDIAGLLSHVCLIAAPNWGLHLGPLPKIARLVGLPWRELYDIDPDRAFVNALNLDDGGEVWTLPKGLPALAIAGVVPRFRDGDGVVSADSASMGGRIPSFTITDRHANHLNVTGETDKIALVLRGFQRSDGVWPQVLDAFCAFVGERAERRSIAQAG